MTPSELSNVAVLLLTLVSQGRETLSAACPTNCFNCDDKDSCINCNSGWYGEDCSLQCRKDCPGGCDKEDGHCTCQEGKYGDYCTDECPSNCKGIQCNIQNGHCEHGCKAGFHGDFCNHPCGNCSSGVCSQETGFCDDCLCGWRGIRCNISCDQDSTSCKVCGGDGVKMPSTTMVSTTSEVWSTTDVKTPTSTFLELTRTSGYDSVAAISIGTFLLVVLLLAFTGCSVAYWKHWFCFQKKRKPASAEEPMYHSDPFGSPTISRSHFNLNKQGHTTMEEEDE
ncbi:platelet endothelial aggregation receptor 1-like isoform X2 [Haliotis rubra]|uniref:platelet endothelial aggregation receptor 1-like isoform X2 n=1 Tax=Haliotis rubra TaxID=36100 RepID=UPI001EE571B3|nr:platelet endothelial aggregation receptor 1-like isoform X2 [Haliotis rubra]